MAPSSAIAVGSLISIINSVLDVHVVQYFFCSRLHHCRRKLHRFLTFSFIADAGYRDEN
jgi:hypothetical protein